MRRGAVIASLVVVALIPACRRREDPTAQMNAANKVAVRAVHIYFESPGALLVSEPRSLSLPESPAAAIPVVVREMMKGPESEGPVRVWPEDTVLRGAYLLPGGTVVVDLGGATLTDGWGTGTHHELMAIHSVAHTIVSNFPEARQVRFLINGTPSETLAGHISLARSHSPDPAMLDPVAR